MFSLCGLHKFSHHNNFRRFLTLFNGITYNNLKHTPYSMLRLREKNRVRRILFEYFLNSSALFCQLIFISRPLHCRTNRNWIFLELFSLWFSSLIKILFSFDLMLLLSVAGFFFLVLDKNTLSSVHCMCLFRETVYIFTIN